VAIEQGDAAAGERAAQVLIAHAEDDMRELLQARRSAPPPARRRQAVGVV
jgi:hypothetical protein